jgi:hypothetical protein
MRLIASDVLCANAPPFSRSSAGIPDFDSQF